MPSGTPSTRILDLSGRKFGKWTVVRFARQAKNSAAIWLCRCECGIEKEVRSGSLVSGQTTQCRQCLAKDQVEDLTGRTIGNWEVVELVFDNKGRIRWRCICKCGKQGFVTGNNLKFGKSQSCGACREIRPGRKFRNWTVVSPRGRKWLSKCKCGHEKELTEAYLRSAIQQSCSRCKRAPKIHGYSRHPYYAIWRNIVARTTLPSDRDYESYGGRGIKLFEEWKESPIPFIEWIDENLGERPEGASLDRKDNDGNYEPGNLRWADNATQSGNRRSVKKLQRKIQQQDAEIKKLRSIIKTLDAQLQSKSGTNP